MLSMMSVVRPLLATVMCAGLGLAIAPSNAPTHDQPTLTCAHQTPCAAAIDWTIDTPDFVAPAAVAAPTRPAVATRDPAAAPAPDVAPRAEVLDVAPKTSPPRA
jgi:hypothetical protein